MIGRQFGYALLVKYGPKIHITKRMIDRSETWFHRFGKFAVTLGYFIPGVRHVTAYFAGISRWSYRLFFVCAAPGALIWVVAFVTLGTYLGEHWRKAAEAIHQGFLLVMLVVIVVFGTAWAIRRKTREHGYRE